MARLALTAWPPRLHFPLAHLWWLAGEIALSAFCFLAGAVLGLGAAQLDLLLFGAVCGLAFLFVPSGTVLGILVLLSFIVVGISSYFFSFDRAFWLPYMICMLLFVKLPVEALRSSQAQGRTKVKAPVFQIMLLLMLMVFCLSVAFNSTPAIAALVGAKNYVFVWSVLLLLAQARLDERVLARIWFALLGIAVLQLPFAIYQHFFIASAGRVGETSWDAVVGTFGGHMDGGGASGALAIFEVLAILLTITLHQAGALRKGVAIGVVAAALVTILLAEVKVVFVLLPVVVLGVLGKRLLRKPLLSLAALVGTLAVLSVIFVAYQQMYWSQSDRNTLDARNALTYVFRFDTDDRLVNLRTGEVSRLAAPLIWWHETSARGPDLVLLGYGPSASRISETIGYGVAARRYPFRLDTSSLTVLLWDLGLAGLFCFMALLGAAALTALRLAGHAALPPLHGAVMRAAPTALAIFLITLPYNPDAVDNAAIQLLICLFLGHIAYWHRRIASIDLKRRREQADSPPAHLAVAARA